MTTGYSDLNPNMFTHPDTGDLLLLKGKHAVFQAFKTIVLSGLNDFIMLNNIQGGGIFQSLFDNYTPLLGAQIQSQIENIAMLYEPRITVKKVSVENPDFDTMVILIGYLYQNETTITTNQITLKRNG